jgi:bifunctional oligoribonuclease and PAP phosphatase NrnA
MGWNDPAAGLEALLPDLKQRLHQAQNILLTAHIRPDGDAIGSVLGFGLALERAGKTVQMVLTDGVPASFRHLPGSDRVQTRVQQPVDLIVYLDCAELDRAGSAIQQLGQPDINIDHHITNTGYAKINLVDAKAAATTEILAQIFPWLDLTLDQDVASVLLMGLITDTIGFRTTSMTPNVLRVAADLMEKGADLQNLYAKALHSRSFEAARFWGAGLSALEREDRMVWTTLSLADRRDAGYPGRDDADLVNILSSIEDAQVVILFVEQPGQKVKVSWRAKPDYDVSRLAVQFGGGGHPAAAGAELPGTIEDVRPVVLQATRQLLYHNHSTPAGNLRHHSSQLEQE